MIPTRCYLFQMDATFKLSTCGYPLIVFVLSNAARQFHAVAFFITSQRTSVLYVLSMKCVKDVFFQVTKRDFDLRHSTGNAEDTQYNA